MKTASVVKMVELVNNDPTMPNVLYADIDGSLTVDERGRFIVVDGKEGLYLVPFERVLRIRLWPRQMPDETEAEAERAAP